MHEELVTVWGQLIRCAGGSFDRRGDVFLSLLPAVPVPQFNGVWVDRDSAAATEALPGLLAEVEAAGAQAWLQLRPGHDRVRAAAEALGCVEAGRVPGMLATRDSFAGSPSDVEIAVVGDEDFAAATDAGAESFGLDRDFMEWFNRLVERLPGCTWYAARVAGEVVSTGIGVTTGETTAIFNVATPARHRGRGYGAAVTVRAVQDGFDAGAQHAILQSSSMGHGVYRRLGFEDVVEYTLLTRPRVD